MSLCSFISQPDAIYCYGSVLGYNLELISAKYLLLL